MQKRIALRVLSLLFFGLTLGAQQDVAVTDPNQALKATKAKEAAQKKADKYKITYGAAHGYAFLERIRNLTDFPASVFYKKTIHDQLPMDSMVRIKSFKEKFGLEGKYYAARLVGGGWRLKADTDDPEDPATQFIVHRHVSRDLSDWIGLSSTVVGKRYLNAMPSNATQFGADDFSDDMRMETHWKVVGSNLQRCSLKNRLTQGLLSCRDKEDKQEVGKYVPPPPVQFKTLYTKKEREQAGWYRWSPRLKTSILGRSDVPKLLSLSWLSKNPYKAYVLVKRKHSTFGDKALKDTKEWVQVRDAKLSFVKAKPKDSDFLTKLLQKKERTKLNRQATIKSASEETFRAKNPYSLREMICYINKTRHHIPAKGNIPVAIAAIKRFAAEADQSRARVISQKKELHYGDKVRIVHHDTWQQLYAENKTIFCANEDSPNEYNNESNSWWIIKGPHKINDPWNCQIGTPVKNGDIIRLEHEQLHKNLMCSKEGSPPKAKTIWGSKPDDGKEYLTTLAGSKGVGNSADNWIINFENDDDSLYKGANFYLTHRNTGFSLRSHTELISKKPNKQRVVAFQKKKANCRWFVNGVSYGDIPVIDIAWTGFPNGSPAIDETPKEAIGFEIVKLGMGGGIKPNTTLDFYMPIKDKKPKVSGFAKEEVPGFGAGYMVKLSPLISKGVAWIEQSFETEGKATVAFLTRVSDKGDAQVIFGNNINLDYTWKIVIGADRNGSSKIIKRTLDVQGNAQEEVVAQVKKADNPLATPTPGTFVPYWISVDDGLILVGASTTPGENIFMAWRDPNPRSDVSRIGFGTHDAFVEYTGIEVRDPVTLQKPEKVYAKATSGVSVSSPDPKWLSTPFRVPGRGTFEFEVSGDKDAMIYLSEKKSAKNKHYQLVLSADETGNAVLRKWDERSKMYIDLVKTSTQYREKNQLNTKEYKKFWISLAKGRIFIGRGEIGQGLFLYHWDMKPLEKILNLGVACSGGTTSFRNVVIAPPVDVSVAEKREAYVQEQDRFKFRGSLHVISPYEYVLSQEGQAVKFEDKINHKTYYPGKTPQQDAKYYFMLMLHKDGFPELVWAREPENPQKLSIEKRASILRAESDTWFQASTWVQGMGVLGGLAGVAASIRYAEKGIDLGKEAGVKETAANLNFRSHDSYVYTDQAVAQQLAQAHVPEEARANKMKAEEKIELGGKWSPSTIDKLERLIPLYQQVINLVNHPFVVRDQYIKKSLFDAISTMYESHQDIHAHPQAPVDLTYSGMINLLVSAYNNPYLIDLNKKKEMKLKEVWYSQINELARQMLQKDPETKVSLQPCYGEYVWLNDQFEEPGKGSVSFEAKGTNDIFVAFASMPTRVRNTDNEIYETVLGGWDNEKAVIRVRSLDKSVSESFDKKLNVNQIKYQRYWVSVKDGQMNLGTGDLDIKNIIFSWKDPYPIKDVQFVGISNWNAAVKFKNVQIGPAVEDVEEYKAKIIAQIMELRQKQAQASVIESEEDLTETPVEPYDEEATEYAGEVEPEVITDQVEEMAPVEDEEELSMAEIVESEKTVEEEIEQLIEPAVEPFVEEDTVVDQEAAIKEETTAVKEEPVVKYRTVRRGRYTYQEPIK